MPTCFGNQPAPYRGLSGPPGPKSQSRLENVSRGLRPRDPQKSQKSLGDRPGSLRRVSGKCLESVFGLSPGLLETFWAPAPGDIFETFLGFRARRARETSVRGGLVPNTCYHDPGYQAPLTNWETHFLPLVVLKRRAAAP